MSEDEKVIVDQAREIIRLKGVVKENNNAFSSIKGILDNIPGKTSEMNRIYNQIPKID
jgi:hypothetical protein